MSEVIKRGFCEHCRQNDVPFTDLAMCTDCRANNPLPKKAAATAAPVTRLLMISHPVRGTVTGYECKMSPDLMADWTGEGAHVQRFRPIQPGESQAGAIAYDGQTWVPEGPQPRLIQLLHPHDHRVIMAQGLEAELDPALLRGHLKYGYPARWFRLCRDGDSLRHAALHGGFMWVPEDVQPATHGPHGAPGGFSSSGGAPGGSGGNAGQAGAPGGSGGSPWAAGAGGGSAAAPGTIAVTGGGGGGGSSAAAGSPVGRTLTVPPGVKHVDVKAAGITPNPLKPDPFASIPPAPKRTQARSVADQIVDDAMRHFWEQNPYAKDSSPTSRTEQIARNGLKVDDGTLPWDPAKGCTVLTSRFIEELQAELARKEPVDPKAPPRQFVQDSMTAIDRRAELDRSESARGIPRGWAGVAPHDDGMRMVPVSGPVPIKMKINELEGFAPKIVVSMHATQAQINHATKQAERAGCDRVTLDLDSGQLQFWLPRGKR